jgi:hypothetical protein
MHKCTNTQQEFAYILSMVTSELFEVTVAADGSKLSSERVSKLTRKYHHLKKIHHDGRPIIWGMGLP